MHRPRWAERKGMTVSQFGHSERNGWKYDKSISDCTGL